MKFEKLEKLCIEVIDCPHSTPQWLESGIRVIRNFNLDGAHFDFSKASYVACIPGNYNMLLSLKRS
jgi:type I restriction enzyme S subunit